MEKSSDLICSVFGSLTFDPGVLVLFEQDVAAMAIKMTEAALAMLFREIFIVPKSPVSVLPNRDAGELKF